MFLKKNLAKKTEQRCEKFRHVQSIAGSEQKNSNLSGPYTAKMGSN